jgi:hypothetical protein
MSLKIIHLRKLLKILYSEQNRRISSLRSDIREDILREAGEIASGGDFYGPFWKDAKDHVFGKEDLTACTDARIASNPARANLYPRLRDGFLLWWNERRRWTNAPFLEIDSPKTRFNFPELDTIVKVDNILSVRDGRTQDRFIYPYFSPEPILGEEAARLGLWLLSSALPAIPKNDFRILDVIRGRTYSVEPDRNPLVGNEEEIFRDRYLAVLDQWEKLRQEYDGRF